MKRNTLHTDSNNKTQAGNLLASFIEKDVPYGSESEAQKLDIFLPAAGRKPYPVIIWIHPGGFFEGDKGGGGAQSPTAVVDMNKLIRPILARGYAMVSMNYRLSHEARFPSVIYDAKAAVRWVRGTATKYNFSTEKVASWGSSAGGYLSAFLAVSEGVREVEDLSMGYPDQSSRVIAAIDWYGCTDFLAMDPQHMQLGQEPWQGGHDGETSPESKLIGGPIRSFPERCKASNPVSYVTSNHAPIYIQHGRNDDIVPYLQSVLLVEKLRTVGGPEVIFEVIENAGHADPLFFASENVNKMLDFLDNYLK